MKMFAKEEEIYLQFTLTLACNESVWTITCNCTRTLHGPRFPGIYEVIIAASALFALFHRLFEASL